MTAPVGYRPAGGALPFVAYAGLVVGGTGVAAYPLYRLAENAGVAWAPFNEFTYRLLEIAAVLCLFPLLRMVGLRGRVAWGYGGARSRLLREFGRGLVLGLASLAAIAAVLLAFGARVPDPGFTWTAAAVARLAFAGLVVGVVVAIVEETWFRGALLSAIAVRWSGPAAVTATAVLFAAVHFVRPDVPVPAEALRWWSGLSVIGDSFHRFADPGIADSFLALLVAGAWLGVERVRRGDIGACIGIHAGWVIAIRGLKDTTAVAPDSPWSTLVGGYDGVVGVAAAAVFVPFAFLSLLRRRP